MAKYLRYVIRNLEPLRIADDSSSQRGQTATIRYIPGSTIRGLVVNALSSDEKFESIKKSLFSSDIRFLNAYPAVSKKDNKGGKDKDDKEIIELIPSPKGFDEDKTECSKKEIINSLIDKSKTKGGLKRASIGRYCYLENGCIYYYDVPTGSDMKIKINLEMNEKRNVFRNEYIKPNHLFVGYIAIEAEELGTYISNAFEGQIILGNGRSAGMGKCRVESFDYCEKIPYEQYQVQSPLFDECYMLLLSNTAMRDQNGEYCGLDMESLGKQMGVENLKIELCSTAAVEVKGFNRNWRGKIPSVMMYEQGSVFRLSYKGEFAVEKSRRLLDRGIGVRRNEGFGRVIFLKDFEEIHYKQEEDLMKESLTDREYICTEDDEEVLKAVARCYYRNQIITAIDRYVVDHPLIKGDVADSQLGQIEALSTSYQYEPQKGIEEIRKFFAHAKEKEEKNNIQKDRNSIYPISETVGKILDEDLENTLEITTKKQNMVMGVAKREVLNQTEADMLKLQFLTTWLRYYNKQEKEKP